MEFTGKAVDAYLDIKTGKWQVTFEVNETQSVIDGFDKIKDCEKLSVKAVKYHKKRSKDANAYAWVLMQKIAEAIKDDKEHVYLMCLQKYSRAFTHVIVKESAIDKMKVLYRTFIDLGKVTVNGQTGHQLQVYFGSSTFDSKEMAVFIDGIISECKDLGIETLPSDEIERMKATWQNA